MQLISQRYLINIALIIAVVVSSLASIYSYLQIQELNRANQLVIHTHEVIESAGQIIYGITDAESRISFFIISKNPDHIKPLANIMNQIEKQMFNLRYLTKDNSTQHKKVVELEKLTNEKLNLMNQILELPSNANIEQLRSFTEKRFELKTEIESLITLIINEELRLLKLRSEISQNNMYKANLILFSAMSITTILLIAFIFFINYQLDKKIKAEIHRKHSENELKKSNNKLTRIQERYNLAVKGSNIGLWDWKVGDDYVYFSPNFKKLLGFSKNEFPNLFSSFDKVLHADDRERVYSNLQKHLEDKLPYKIEYRLRNKNGEFHWYQASGEAIRDASGKAVRMSGSLTNIDDVKRIEKMKNEFISIASHELKTPLTSIHGALAILITHKLVNVDADTKHLLEIAKSNSERLMKLINNILDVEKIESGNLEYEFKPYRILDIIVEALNLNKIYADKFSINLTVNNKTENVFVIVDRDKLIQVITNLLSNAIKFSPKNSQVIIQIATVSAYTVRVSIIDKGKGIPENFHGRIFQKFSQADSSSSRKHEGTGLGLSISKTIIQDMNGTISFNTKENEGTEFYFDLPIWS